ncbi:hypothetical protein WDV85_09720 [Pseudokineococcus sp. 5B2Z-1]|uniref:hypothetical protein n=1 Tax=Pseudokineococcus sp. 5B2Z-1 TaxID=3132744 RepID=UPI0030A338E8
MATWDVAPGQALESGSASFTALVARLGCNSGVTGEVNPPHIEETDDVVTITFTVSPGPPEAADCPSHDAVPYEVELSSPLEGRLLVDGACETTEARTTTDCDPDGTRSPS